MAGLFGGSILIPGRIPDEGLLQYIRSVEHFGEMARKMNVEVELQNHPLYDGLEGKLERLKTRQAGPGAPLRGGPGVVSAVPDGDDRMHAGADRAEEALRRPPPSREPLTSGIVAD